MSRGRTDKITYKKYIQGEQLLLPPSLEELVPETHFARTVNTTVEELGIRRIVERHCKGGGTSRYAPEMMVKILIYCYTNGIYSSRQIAKQCRENVNVMWLAAGQKPDFRIINNFRSGQLKKAIDEIFVECVKLLHRKGYVSLEKMFIDGTKIESAANKYTFVWKKGVEKLDAKLDEKLREVIRQADEIMKAENLELGDRNLPELGEGITVTSEEIKDAVNIISERIKKLEETEAASNPKESEETAESTGKQECGKTEAATERQKEIREI